MSSGLKKLPEKKRHSWAVTGTEIFALLNFIAAIATLLICLGILLLYITESINHTDNINSFMWCMCLGTNLGVLIAFVFSVLLYLGIYQKRTNFLLYYVIYGVFVDILLLSAVVASYNVSINADLKRCLRSAFGDIHEPVAYAVIGICIVHIFLLNMICRARSSIIRSRCSEDHQKLVDDSIWTTEVSKDVLSTRLLKNLQEIAEMSAPKKHNVGCKYILRWDEKH